MSTSQEVVVIPAIPTVQNAQGQQPTVLPVLVPLRLTLTLASVQVPSTSQEVAVFPAIQGATAAQALETLTAMLASSEETLLMGVNARPKSTMTEVLVITATAIVQSARGQAIPSAQLVTLEKFCTWVNV